ncbi:MAG: methanogenesis marker 5 protein [Archaeoglobales archaeon]|nr:methanogenesis marker 5 protein [Archaeoglobales archaeon]
MKTRIFVISPDSGINSEELIFKILGHGFNGTVKETCFGAMVEGEEKEVEKIVDFIRREYYHEVFTKDRGYPIGDKRICRAERGGGARSGLYQIEYEAGFLPFISQALRDFEIFKVKNPKKIIVHPINSLILADLVERAGHYPVTMMEKIGNLVRNPEIDSPPRNITTEDVVRGLKYASVEMPSGIRGRLGVWDSLIEQAEAALIANYDYAFGCAGCTHNDILIYLIKARKIPYLRLNLPRNYEEGKEFVKKIFEFLKNVGD